MDYKKITQILADQPAYRLKQVKIAVFRDLLDDWQKASNLPKDLREKLNVNAPLDIKSKLEFSDNKKTVKALLDLADGNKIETVLMRHSQRNTVCVSSQVGCPLGCLFCATGQLGYKRNLDPGEIVSQVLFFSRYLKETGERVSNVVFMGMGEPFLNYDNILAAIEILNDKDGLNIGARHISISTIGIPEGINKLAAEKMQLNLAVSLHAPNDELRQQIIPLNKKYRLKNILRAVSYYLEATNRQIMLEYIMIKGFNDSAKQAEELVALLQELPKKLYVINLILYNPSDFPAQEFKPSDKKQVGIFKHILGRNKIRATERYRFGREISAACGQLAGKN